MNKTEHVNAIAELVPLIKAGAEQKLPPELNLLAVAARELHGDSVCAVLFYGSCLRSGSVHEGLADLYLLVDDYRSTFNNPVMAVFNKLLPPNVFYLEVPFEGHTLRAKYAVLSLPDFRKGTKSWFHSYIWGRFCQRSSIVYCRDESVALQVHEALAAAVVRFVMAALPQMPGRFTARELWSRGLSLSYRSELRTEQPDDTAARLYDTAPDYYQTLTGTLLGNPPNGINVSCESPDSYYLHVSEREQRLNSLTWRIRSLQGKILSILRLLKGLFTFKGGIDYIQWKIERHSGVRVEVSETLKRLPPLAIVVIFWRFYRQGAFR